MGDSTHGQTRVVAQALVKIIGIFRDLLRAKLRFLAVSFGQN
jgi:hypothetical protein